MQRRSFLKGLATATAGLLVPEFWLPSTKTVVVMGDGYHRKYDRVVEITRIGYYCTGKGGGPHTIRRILESNSTRRIELEAGKDYILCYSSDLSEVAPVESATPVDPTRMVGAIPSGEGMDRFGPTQIQFIPVGAYSHLVTVKLKQTGNQLYQKGAWLTA